jgi:hypothetical protein
MKEFLFEVGVRAAVRVRASGENVAREVLPSVLGAPGTVELRLANEINAAIGIDATVADVHFVVESNSILLREMNENAAADD